MTTTEHILGLVRRALDEFDDVDLETTTRRTVRIASLLGDSKLAVRLGLELQPMGGHPPANGEDTRRLMADPASWGDPTGPAEQAIAEYMADRRREDGMILSHSIAELEFWQEKFDRLSAEDRQPDRDLLERRILGSQVLGRARQHTFAALVAWERQLSYSNSNEGIFRRFQEDVDPLLNEGAPHLLEMFNSVYRRLREASSADPTQPVSEELAQAVTTCRRILKAVADHVLPPADEDGTGRLGDDQYRNRLREFTRRIIGSDTLRQAADAEVGGLWERFAAVDKLANKGVHARLALREAELCAISTYIVTGEILRVHREASASPGRPV